MKLEFERLFKRDTKPFKDQFADALAAVDRSIEGGYINQSEGESLRRFIGARAVVHEVETFVEKLQGGLNV